MPIFEYVCQTCEHRFESIVYGHRQPRCPACDGVELEKLLSTFAVATSHSSTHETAPAPCGRCGDPRGPGACSLN